APPEDMCGRDQEQADAAARPRFQREHRVRRVAGEERSGALRPEALREASRAREPCPRDGEIDRVQQTVWSRQERSENDRLVVAPARDEAIEDVQVGAAIIREAFRRGEERTLGGHGSSVVERMRGRSVWLGPADRELEGAEERGIAAGGGERRGNGG